MISIISFFYIKFTNSSLLKLISVNNKSNAIRRENVMPIKSIFLNSYFCNDKKSMRNSEVTHYYLIEYYLIRYQY